MTDKKHNIRWFVFTDMDGTLLDHDTYEHSAAIPMLKRLYEAGIPVIPNTSKTYAELIPLRQSIGLTGPFILENGAAACIPHGVFPQKPSDTQWQNDHWVKQFTSRKNYWVNLLRQEKENFPDQFTHFSEMSVEEICAATGLEPAQAELASERQYGEPVMWLGDHQQKARFVTAMRLKGASPLQGGRFLHISGDCNKGAALSWFMRECQRQFPDTLCKSIALGDGENDNAMLEAADVAVQIRSPSHSLPKLLRTENVWVSKHTGPQGWAETLEKILFN